MSRNVPWCNLRKNKGICQFGWDLHPHPTTTQDPTLPLHLACLKKSFQETPCDIDFSPFCSTSHFDFCKRRTEIIFTHRVLCFYRSICCRLPARVCLVRKRHWQSRSQTRRLSSDGLNPHCWAQASFLRKKPIVLVCDTAWQKETQWCIQPGKKHKLVGSRWDL